MKDGYGSNVLVKPTEMVGLIARRYGKPGDVAVDATAGNGGDTLFLARLVNAGGPGGGRVYAFDLQEEALARTRTRLSQAGYEEGESLRLILDNHAHMADHVKEPLSVVLFNLGYLPGGDKSVTTCADSTLAAVEQGLALLKKNGVLIITLYPGHEEGGRERELLTDYVKNLPGEAYHGAQFRLINQKKNPPEILAITKKEEGKIIREKVQNSTK